MKTQFAILLVGLVAGYFLGKTGNSSAPESEYVAEAPLEQIDTKCAEPIEEVAEAPQPVKKVAISTPRTSIQPKTSQPPKEKKLSVDQLKDPTRFKNDYEKAEARQAEVLRWAVQVEVPSGEVIKEEPYHEGFRIIERTADGDEIQKIYDENEKLQTVRWEKSNGEFLQRRYDDETGRMAGAYYMDKNGKEKVSVGFNRDGVLTYKSLRTPSGDTVSASYTDGKIVDRFRQVGECQNYYIPAN